jgi:hypothetical protein
MNNFFLPDSIKMTIFALFWFLLAGAFCRHFILLSNLTIHAQKKKATLPKSHR